MEIKRIRIATLLLAVLALASAACLCTGGLGALQGLGGGGGRYSELDGYDTTLEQTISYNQTQSATLDSLSEAHNWDFSGNAGDAVTIRANAVGDSDPRINLIDPNGNIIATDDDGGGSFNSLITTTLPSGGTYTVRVDMFVGGTYELTVQN